MHPCVTLILAVSDNYHHKVHIDNEVQNVLLVCVVLNNVLHLFDNHTDHIEIFSEYELHELLCYGCLGPYWWMLDEFSCCPSLHTS